MASCAEIAAIIHADMCNDERNGYSWDPRWGGDHPDGWKTLVIDGREYSYPLGSYDCSSSTSKAWQLAIQYTKYAGALDGATYTGNMRSVFLNSGLFDAWDTNSTEAVRGDLYLNEGSHVAMCQYGGQDGTWDSLSEFSINEVGDVDGGAVGDQTGWESHITDFYNFPWDLTLHYNGAADSSIGDNTDGGNNGDYTPPVNPTPGNDPQWQGDVIGKSDTTDAGDDYACVFGKPILYLAVEGVGKYQAHDFGKDAAKWWEFVDKYDLNDEENGMAGSGVPIDAIRITDPTVFYQTHNLNGDWNPVMQGTKDLGGSSDDFAGEYGVAQDAIRIWRESGNQPRYNVFS